MIVDVAVVPFPVQVGRPLGHARGGALRNPADPLARVEVLVHLLAGLAVALRAHPAVGQRAPELVGGRIAVPVGPVGHR